MAVYINERQAAERYNVAIQTLRNWRSVRKGPPYIKLERLVRYAVEETDRYFQSHRVDPEAK